MWWECENCGYKMNEYACLGHGSEVDNGCPNCGNQDIWFHHFGYPAGNKGSKTLINVKSKETLREESWDQRNER